MNDDLIYALDVGTRKVMGIVARRTTGGIEVLACDVVEHSTRAMSAGEVRDVRAVAEVIRGQAARLSERIGAPLTRASIAVAGRDLRTVCGRADVVLPQPGPVDPDSVRRATLEAVSEALSRLPRDEKGGALSSHCCVGYAATRFRVDGDELSDPVGHHAARLEAEVLATILPRRVLDSLIAALDRAGLKPATITLEPIAALQAAVPEDLRRFHIALVDVGAGTSDIAIVRGGTISAFGMVPFAGDFITEALADIAALDFFSAERAKRELSAGRDVLVRDVFDNPRALAPASTLPLLSPAVGQVAKRIAESIRALSGGPPRLVLCVGGGSLTAGLQEALAAELGLAQDRVGRRRVCAEGLPEEISGPQAATPLGIALVAAAGRGLSLRRLRLDGRPHFALEVGRPLTVLDALVAAGVSGRDIHGRLGLSVTYTINGAVKSARGTCGQPGSVSCDGRPAALDEALSEGACLAFQPAEPGQGARQTLGQALAASGLERKLLVAGREVTIHPLAMVDGAPADPDVVLHDRARVEWRRWPTLGEILAWTGGAGQGEVLIDGAPAKLDAVPADGARVEFGPSQAPRGGDAASAGGACVQAARAGIAVTLNGVPVVLERSSGRAHAAESSVLLVDLLPRAGAALTPVAGRRLRLSIDGSPAGYTTPLHHGAEVTIGFE